MNKQENFETWAGKWLTMYKKSYVRKSTFKESYERTVNNYLIPAFEGRNLNSITPLDIRELMSELANHYSSSTLSKILICLNGIFNAAMENNVIIKNPAVNIKPPKSALPKKEKQTYSAEEVNDILQFAKIHEYGIYIQLLIELGLRCSELCGLKWSDIDFTAKTVSIKRACTACEGRYIIDDTKNRSSCRILPLSSDLVRRLKAKCPRHKNCYIVVSRRDNVSPLTPSSFTKVYYKRFFDDYIKHTLEVDRVLSPHELRHTCGTLLYNRTNDIYAVSKYLGHSSISTTARLYVHSDPEALRYSLQIF